MKKLLIFFISTFPGVVLAQWNDVSSGKIGGAGICYAIAEDTVVITAGNGKIYTTYDGGTSFDSVQTIFNFGEWFNDLQFPSADKGYFCGGTAFGHHRNFLASSDNMGQNWDTLTTNQFSGYNFTNIFFVSDSVGFISGEYNLLLKTTDAGKNFTTINLPFPGSVTDIFFPSSNVGYVSFYRTDANNADVYQIFKTTDLGSTWNEVYYDSVANRTFVNDRRIFSLYFISDNLGYGSGSNGRFIKTTDGGTSWNVYQLKTDTTFFPKVYFSNANTGYIITQEAYAGKLRNTLKTRDGGNTWHPIPYKFKSISFANDTVGYAIENGLLYKTTNGGGITGIIEGESSKSAIEFNPNPAINLLHLKTHGKVKVDEVEVFDQSGKLVHQFKELNNGFDISSLKSGLYFFKVKTNEGFITKKIIVLPK